MILCILGRALRTNLQWVPGAVLEPVLAIWEGSAVAYGLGAVVPPPARIVYHPQATGPYGETWIETEGRIEIFPTALRQPSGPGVFIHTNTRNAQSNRKVLREGQPSVLKPVLMLRAKRHAPAQAAEQIETTAPLWLIYACAQNQLSPLPCGARVWGFTQGALRLNGYPPSTPLQPRLF